MMLGALLGVCIISRALDGAGLLAASAIGSIIGFLGHWTWLSLLIFFLLLHQSRPGGGMKKKRDWALQKLTTVQEDGKTPWQMAGLRPSQSYSMMQWGARMGSHCIVLQCCGSNVRHTCLRDRGHGFPYQKYSLLRVYLPVQTGNVPNWDAEFSRWIPHNRDRSTGPDG